MGFYDFLPFTYTQVNKNGYKCKNKKNDRCNMSNSKDRVWPHFQTPRRELKTRRAAEYFWRTSRCLGMSSNTSWEFHTSSQSKLKLRSRSSAVLHMSRTQWQFGSTQMIKRTSVWVKRRTWFSRTDPLHQLYNKSGLVQWFFKVRSNWRL